MKNSIYHVTTEKDSKILEKFRENFNPIQGNEYFQGDTDKMKKIFEDVASKLNPIYTGDNDHKVYSHPGMEQLRNRQYSTSPSNTEWDYSTR